MKPPSIPKINKDNPKLWFIYWNQDVPVELWQFHKRKRERIKIYEDINSYSSEERETYAEFRRKVWEYALFQLSYNPFEQELNQYRELQLKKMDLTEQIEEIESLTEEENRMLLPVDKAFHEFIKSRVKRKLDKKSVSSYQSTVDWLNEGLNFNGHGNVPIGKIKHIHLSAALDYIAEKREWVATTINKQIGFLMSIFNWLETEDYVLKNPSKNKFLKLQTNKTMHRWYDRETKEIIKEAVLKAGKDKVYRAMQFTYWILIRSKEELRKLKIEDIDRSLKRIRFSAALSKNSTEQYRDYPDEFEQILNEMELDKFPKTWYVFGSKDGSPGPKMCGHNFFSNQFKPIKDKLKLSPDYTIYGMKHTRIVHELMKGTEGMEISHMARHSDFKTTKDYLRDYDITLKQIYKPEDLTF